MIVVDTNVIAYLQAVTASRCSAYDCEFVALARELEIPLVTNDRQILRDFPDVALPLARPRAPS